MANGVIWLVLGIIFLFALPFIIRPLFAAIYALLAALGMILFTALDELCSASLIPAAPWLMWMLWGALIGAALAFWTMAPVFGLRKHRSLIGVAPLILMALLGVVRMMLRG